jgi:carbon monoxide dehydrogenase subunit G
MPSLSEEITIPLPITAVWPVLADPALVATCIPGASLTATEVSGVYHGSVRVRLGPVVATFRGEVRIAYHPDTLSCSIEGRGIDGGGLSRAVGKGIVHVGGGDETVVRAEGEYTVNGPLDGAADSGGSDAARILLGQLRDNIVKLLTTEGAPAPEAEEIPLVEPQTATQQARALMMQQASASAAGNIRGAELWRAAVTWLRQVFSG